MQQNFVTVTHDTLHFKDKKNSNKKWHNILTQNMGAKI